jgi:YVTN family beta-propeller protein
MRLALWLLIPCALVVVLAARGQTPSTGRLLVLSKGDLTLSVIDPITLKVIGKVPSGPDPHEVAATADGRRAYISNYGAGRGGFNTLTVADLVDFKPLPPVDLGPLRGPHGMASAGGKIYFTAEVSKVIGRVDPATNVVDWVVGTGQDISHMVVVAPDLQRLFTVNVQSGSASVIERAAGRAGRFAPAADNDWTIASVKVGESADDFEGFDVSPDGRELWTVSPRGKIAIVDVERKTLKQSIDADISGANRVKFTLDGKHVLVSRLSARAGSGSIVVFDAATHQEVKRIDTGGGVGGLLMQPDGTRAYGSSSRNSVVAVIDLKTFSLVGTIDAGRNPDGVAWAAAP